MTSPTPPDVAKEHGPAKCPRCGTFHMCNPPSRGDLWFTIRKRLCECRKRLELIGHCPVNDEEAYLDAIASHIANGVAAVNATQATCKQSLQVGWTPASTPPTGTGWYVVVTEQKVRLQSGEVTDRRLGVAGFDGRWTGDHVKYYLPTPLPPLPEKERA